MTNLFTTGFAVVFLTIFASTALLTIIFLARQLTFSIFIHYTKQRSPYRQFDLNQWPSVTVLIPAHNEEKVIEGCLLAMSRLDYPSDALTVLVINDRSTDKTREIVEQWMPKNANLKLHNRPWDAKPGKPSAIKDVIETLETEVVVFFDADYLPDPKVLKQLVVPLVDPQIGATMGRVVPYNTNTNLLTKLIDLERRGGYVVDQQARNLLNLLPQFGGTLGAVRMDALKRVGGWREDLLAEDTDLTYRLFLNGWSVEYLNHAMCYEESPEEWPTRFKQVRRWAYGHNECFNKYFLPVLKSKRHTLLQRIDAAIVLLFYLFPSLSFVCLCAAFFYPVFYDYPPFNMTLFPAISFMIGFGNLAPYFQILVALEKDRQPNAVKLLPLLFVTSTISMLASMSALMLNIRHMARGEQLAWDKTIRFRI